VQKRQSSQHCHFALLGSSSVKVVRRSLMKLNPDKNKKCFADQESRKKVWNSL
jgi:hypothetical protein